MIFDTSPLFDETDKPIFLCSPVWRTVLSCFTFCRAMTVDLNFGALESNWLMEEKMSGIPSSNSWLYAACENSIGLLVHLHKFGIPCPYVDDIVQYSIKKNRMLTLLLFTSDFVFHGLDGHPLKDSKFVPRIDKAVTRGYQDIVRYCVWRYDAQKDKLLSSHLKVLSHLCRSNALDMFTLIVPRITKVDNLVGLKHACQKGFTELVDYAMKHIDPHFSTPENIVDGLMVIAAQNGHLEILRILKNYKGKFIPRKAYQQAFAYGKIEACKYIQQRFPDYVPDQEDIIEACSQGHVDTIASLPQNTILPDECMEKAVKSKEPKLIKILSTRMPHYKYKQSLLKEALHSKNSEMLLFVFACGDYDRLPPGADTTLAQNRMQKAMMYFHKIGLRVYTEQSFIEACRICCIDIIRDILELPIGQRPFISEYAWNTALCAIHVSPERRQTKRMEAHDYVNAKFKEFKEHPEFYKPNDEPVVLSSSRSDDSDKEEDDKPKKVKVKQSSTSLHNKRSSRDNIGKSKRQKHVHGQTNK